MAHFVRRVLGFVPAVLFLVAALALSVQPAHAALNGYHDAADCAACWR